MIHNIKNKLKIGITGQSGFIGTHLYNKLGLYPNKFERIPFKDEYFNNDNILQRFISKCDVVIHLAAMNRHNDPNEIYSTNIKLVKQVISACEKNEAKPHILFSSSIQENNDNLYGKSKSDGRELFNSWAKRNNANFTGLIIPNVFGPFGHPYYNSVVATFCYQLTHGEKPRIDINSMVKLIYINELTDYIINHIIEKKEEQISCIQVPHSKEIFVTDLLNILSTIKDNYIDKGVIPNLDDSFIRDLFGTFLTYVDLKTIFPFKLKKHADRRGCFIETVKVNSGGQFSFSTTRPGVTRGDHYHTRKAERFAVIKGNARISIRKIGSEEILNYELSGDEPSFVDMPVWYTHNITNIGNDELYTIFWISEHFNPEDPDTYFEKV